MTGVVLPVRGFEGAKTRLSPRLSPKERARLMQSLADGVVKAAAGREVFVVTSAPEVEEWAASLGLHLLPDTGNLNTAVAQARDVLAEAGYIRVVVTHADLPDLTDLDPFDVGDDGLAVIARSQHDGTAVLSVPTGIEFGFRYGPGSFALHVDEAKRLGLAVREEWVRDVDTPDDL